LWSKPICQPDTEAGTCLQEGLPRHGRQHQRRDDGCIWVGVATKATTAAKRAVEEGAILAIHVAAKAVAAAGGGIKLRSKAGPELAEARGLAGPAKHEAGRGRIQR